MLLEDTAMFQKVSYMLSYLDIGFYHAIRGPYHAHVYDRTISPNSYWIHSGSLPF